METDKPASYNRDLIGYGANPTDSKWPGDARLARNFVMNLEGGQNPPCKTERISVRPASLRRMVRGVEGRDLATEGMFE